MYVVDILHSMTAASIETLFIICSVVPKGDNITFVAILLADADGMEWKHNYSFLEEAHL